MACIDAWSGLLNEEGGAHPGAAYFYFLLSAVGVAAAGMAQRAESDAPLPGRPAARGKEKSSRHERLLVVPYLHRHGQAFPDRIGKRPVGRDAERLE